MQAKSLELHHSIPIDISDSILLKKCQQLAQLRNLNQEPGIKDYIDREAIVDADPDHNDTNYEDTLHEETHNVDDSVIMKIKPPDSLSQVVVQNQVVSLTEPATTLKPSSIQLTSVKPVPTEKVLTSVTTSHPHYNYGYKYGNPFYYIYHHFFPELKKIEPIPSSTTTTTTTTPKPSKPMYTEKLRFILRMPYADQEDLSRFPWEFDKYAYYPKNMQPDYVNMAVPYAPTYHMIRRLIVPSKLPDTYVVDTKK